MSEIKITEIDETKKIIENVIKENDDIVKAENLTNFPSTTNLTVDEANVKINEFKLDWDKKIAIHNEKHNEFEKISSELNKLYAEPDSDLDISRFRAKLINASDARYKALIEAYQSLHNLLGLSTELKNQHITALSKSKS